MSFGLGGVRGSGNAEGENARRGRKTERCGKNMMDRICL